MSNKEKNVFLRNDRTGIEYPLNGFIPHDSSNINEDLYPRFSSTKDQSNVKIPSSIDLRSMMTPVENQCNLRSCVVNAVIASCEYLIQKETRKHVDLSRLYLYYYSRLIDVSHECLMSDKGTRPSSAIAAMSQYGCCEERIYPYEESLVNQRPRKDCDLSAQNYKIRRAENLCVELNEMKECLAEGFPFVFGLHLFKSFDQADQNRGFVPLIQPDIEKEHGEHGWHSMLAVGYSDENKYFIVMNSWGNQWGDEGYCYIPYQYMSNRSLCQSLFVIKEVLIPDHLKENGYNFQEDQWFWKEIRPAKKKLMINEMSSKEKICEEFFILWIDEETDEHRQLIDRLKQIDPIKVQFSSNYHQGEIYLSENKEKIRNSPRFLLICRGFYRNEKKNPLDLIEFLDENNLSHPPIITFTQNKEDLIQRLEQEAKIKRNSSWRRRLEITDETNEFISKIEYYIHRR